MPTVFERIKEGTKRGEADLEEPSSTEEPGSSTESLNSMGETRAVVQGEH